MEISSPDDVDRLASLVRELDFGPASLGIADGAFAARCAAHIAAGSGTRTLPRIVVPRGGDAGFLAPLPPSLLPASEAAKEALSALGLRTLALVAALPLEGVQARLGEEGRWLVALARGEPAAMSVLATFVPREAPTIEIDLTDGDPTNDGATSLDAVLFALRAACLRLVPPLAARGEGIGEAEVVLERGRRAAPMRLLVRPARPEIDPNALFELARATLEGAIRSSTGESSFDPTSTAITSLHVTAATRVPVVTEGERLAFARRDATILSLDVALARLRGRFGSDRVLTPERREDPRPEARGTFVAASAQNVAAQSTKPPEAPIELRERLRAPASAIGTIVLSRAPVPGDPWPIRAPDPRGRRVVAEVGSPERVVGGWWSEPYALVYRWVVSNDGVRALFASAAEDGQTYRLVGLAD